MNETLLASHVLLWIGILVQGVLILSLMRQVGSLLLRVGAARPLDAGYGPPIGHRVPWLPADYPGNSTDERALLLVFVSTTCSDCAAMTSPLNAVAKAYSSRLSLLVLSAEDPEELSTWATKHRLQVPVVSAPEALEALGIGGTPYAFVVAPDGTARARGGVNHIEHLEGLLSQCQIPANAESGPVELELVSARSQGDGHH